MATTAQSIRYNQIPKDSVLFTSLKKLGRNEKVKYRVFGSQKSNKPGKFFGPSVILPATDVITDPDTGEVYDIAYVKSVGAGGVQNTEAIEFDDFNAFTLVLFGNNVEHQKMYQYIELSNYLADNPNRSSGKQALIERVDENKDRSANRDRRQKMNAALNTVTAMSDAEILDFVRANRLPDLGTPLARRVQVEDLAERDPDKFAKMPVIDFQTMFSIIDEAKKKKVITYNNVSRMWQRFDGTTILKVQKGLGVQIKEELAAHLARPEGNRDLEWIKAELEK